MPIGRSGGSNISRFGGPRSLVRLVAMTSPREPETTNGESRPSACPACGYDIAGALGVTCPECGVDVVKERERLGPRKNALWVLAPLTVATGGWAFFAQAMIFIACKFGRDPFAWPITWVLWAVFAFHLGLVTVGVCSVRKIDRLPHSTHAKYTWIAWLLMLVPTVLFLILILR
jgi:hypothetical protein